MFRTIATAAAIAAISATGAHAACTAAKAGSELSHAEAQAVYECIEADLVAGYKTGAKRWIPSEYVEGYRDWKLASTAPGAPGFHGNRFLVTYVNEAGWDEYTKFEEERGAMPAGTLIAKESFHVNDAGKVRKGPLFLMEKVAAGTSPATNDWYYMAVSPKGTPMAVNVVTACHACHNDNFDYRDGMGYPMEAVRVAR